MYLPPTFTFSTAATTILLAAVLLVQHPLVTTTPLDVIDAPAEAPPPTQPSIGGLLCADSAPGTLLCDAEYGAIVTCGGAHAYPAAIELCSIGCFAGETQCAGGSANPGAAGLSEAGLRFASTVGDDTESSSETAVLPESMTAKTVASAPASDDPAPASSGDAGLIDMTQPVSTDPAGLMTPVGERVSAPASDMIAAAPGWGSAD